MRLLEDHVCPPVGDLRRSVERSIEQMKSQEVPETDYAVMHGLLILCGDTHKNAEVQWRQTHASRGDIIIDAVSSKLKRAREQLEHGRIQSYLPTLVEVLNYITERQSVDRSLMDSDSQESSSGSHGQVTCLAKMCHLLGFGYVPSTVTKVVQLPQAAISGLRERVEERVCCVLFEGEENQHRNHIELVDKTSRTSKVSPTYLRGSSSLRGMSMSVTTLVELTNPNSAYRDREFYASDGNVGGAADMFGVLTGRAANSADKVGSAGQAKVESSPGDADPNDLVARETGDRRTERIGSALRSAIEMHRDEGRDGSPARSVVNDSQRGGSANAAAGVVRPSKRVIKSIRTPDYSGSAKKSYVSSTDVKFNNFVELTIDTMSPEQVDDVLFRLFVAWQLPMSDRDALKFAEDLVMTFMVARTASNKADYNMEFDVPISQSTGQELDATEVAVNMDVLSRMLSNMGETMRRFARGLADRIRLFLKEESNGELRVRLAEKVGCDVQFASLAFDGSTGCTNLNVSEHRFTRMLEARNLFEDPSQLADKASEQILAGFGGLRPHTQR